MILSLIVVFSSIWKNLTLLTFIMMILVLMMVSGKNERLVKRDIRRFIVSKFRL